MSAQENWIENDTLKIRRAALINKVKSIPFDDIETIQEFSFLEFLKHPYLYIPMGLRFWVTVSLKVTLKHGFIKNIIIPVEEPERYIELFDGYKSRKNQV